MMMMKNSNYIFIALTALSLASCSTQDVVDETGKTPIELNAVMGGNSATVNSRADTYNALIAGSYVYIQVSGTWTGHSPSIVTQRTTTTADAKATPTSTSNNLTFVTPIYWDDYGSADPANSTTGRTEGLTIYGVSSGDGVPGSTPTPTDFTNVGRTLSNDQAKDGWSTKDLLISNNIQDGQEGTYKFDSRSAGATLKFKHALSKITVNLYKGEGFTDAEVTDKLSAAVTIAGLNYTGTVNAKTGVVTATGAVSDITMKKTSTNKNNLDTNPYVTFTALAIPNSTTKQLVKDQTFLTVVVNGNTYYVPANAIITQLGGTSPQALESGKNYIFNVKVSKTAITNISATVVDWTDVTGEQVTPEIVTITPYSDGNTSTTNTPTKFFLWYTKGADNVTSYTTTSTMVGTGATTIPATVTYSSSAYSISPLLYWPNHVDAYHLRGAVWSNGDQPAITASTSGDYISLANGNTSAQDLLYGTHEGTSGVGNGTGAMATKGNIKFTFYHKMSQVTVLLTTPTTADQVTLTNAKVELINSATAGTVLLGSGTVTPGTAVASYPMPSATASNTFESYVIPQTLTDNLKFKITITNTDATTDTYEIALKDIKVSTDGGKTSSSITQWNSGVHYSYTLNIKKTGLSVIATLVPWTTATGSTDVIL
jgi:hypothetical protein